MCSELDEINLLQLEFADWDWVLCLDQVVVPFSHRHREVGPHGWSDGGTGHGIALVDFDIKVNDWHLNAGSQVLVDLCNYSVDL